MNPTPCPSRARSSAQTLRAVTLAAALFVPLSASAFSTANLLSDSVSALSSCLNYRVKGVCFFLLCTPWGCEIETSIRVSHYLPEVVVSTYQHPSGHPWTDWGKTVSTYGWKLGARIMGREIDSQGETSADHHYDKTSLVTFKSADAYGNPAAHITNMSSGGNMSVSNISWPGASELSGWESSYNSSNRGGAGASGSGNFGQNLFGEIFGSGNVNISSSISSIIRSEAPSLQQMGLTGQGQGQGQGDDPGGYIGSGSEYICPGASQLLMPHFISEIDALVWRNKVPLELLDVRSFTPGMGEVSTNPATHTWGNIYPRTGELVQQHPVKNSAVLAERVRTIITQKRQQHVYTAITKPSGYTYFPGSWPAGADVLWQKLHPSPASKSCIKFGTNDSLGLGAFGDGQTSENNAYAWNMWMQHDCCQNKGVFLFSIPPN